MTWAVGDNVSFAGSAVDSDGATIPAGGLAWTLTLVTCGASGGACAEQQLRTWTGVTQGTFTAPDAPYPAYLKLALTATDANGLRRTVERRLDPKTIALTLDASTPGVQLTLGSETTAAPFTRTLIPGSATTITAPSPQTLGTSVYRFGAWSDGGAQTHAITVPATDTTLQARYDVSAVGATIVGTEAIQPTADSNDAGVAEAFRTTAGLTGTVGYLFVYLDGASTATELVAGLYSDAAGKPGTLLTSGRLASPQAGAFNKIVVPNAPVTAGNTYWIAVLGPAGKAGSVRFRMTLGGGRAETSAQSTLTDLPGSWSTGATYSDGPLAAYGAAIGTTAGPSLSVTPTSLSFSATAGAANPAPKTLSITNTGGGTLTYTATDDAPWLTITPTTATAPATPTITVDTTGLTAGTHTATITINATGATNTPQTIPVTLTLTAPPPPSAGLVAAYGFEETTGNTVQDASGTGNTGTVAGATRVTTGRNGRALSFNGSGDNVLIPDAPSLRLASQMTLEAWVYPATLGSQWRTVMLKEQTGGAAYGLYANTNGKRPEAVAWVPAELESRGTASLATNAWTHLAATYDGTTLRFFINGAQVSTKAGAGRLVAATGPLRLGGNSVWGEWFSGRLDDVRVYDRVLSASQIATDMSTAVTPG
jgi:hypothetical protein